MAEFDDKLNSILGNPQIMSQIMSMAGALDQQNSAPAQPSPPQAQPDTRSSPFQPSSLQGMMELLGKTQIDQRQRNLIRALQGYLPSDRIQKLEKAMQAAKIARYASAALGKKSNSGR